VRLPVPGLRPRLHNACGRARRVRTPLNRGDRPEAVKHNLLVRSGLRHVAGRPDNLPIHTARRPPRTSRTSVVMSASARRTHRALGTWVADQSSDEIDACADGAELLQPDARKRAIAQVGPRRHCAAGGSERVVVVSGRDSR
jgi:hypothetical protein